MFTHGSNSIWVINSVVQISVFNLVAPSSIQYQFNTLIRKPEQVLEDPFGMCCSYHSLHSQTSYETGNSALWSSVCVFCWSFRFLEFPASLGLVNHRLIFLGLACSLLIGSAFRDGATRKATPPVKSAIRLEFFFHIEFIIYIDIIWRIMGQFFLFF